MALLILLSDSDENRRVSFPDPWKLLLLVPTDTQLEANRQAFCLSLGMSESPLGFLDKTECSVLKFKKKYFTICDRETL